MRPLFIISPRRALAFSLAGIISVTAFLSISTTVFAAPPECGPTEDSASGDFQAPLAQPTGAKLSAPLTADKIFTAHCENPDAPRTLFADASATVYVIDGTLTCPSSGITANSVSITYSVTQHGFDAKVTRAIGSGSGVDVWTDTRSDHSDVTLPSTTYKNEGLTPNTTYTYKLQSKLGDGALTPYADVASATCTTPAQPDLTATVSFTDSNGTGKAGEYYKGNATLKGAVKNAKDAGESPGDFTNYYEWSIDKGSTKIFYPFRTSDGLDNLLFPLISTESLAPNTTRDIQSYTWLLGVTSGSGIYLRSCADRPTDGPDSVAESNETNNCSAASGPFKVIEKFNYNISVNNIAIGLDKIEKTDARLTLTSGTTQPVALSLTKLTPPPANKDAITKNEDKTTITIGSGESILKLVLKDKSVNPASPTSQTGLTTITVTTGKNTPLGDYKIDLTGVTANLVDQTKDFTVTVGNGICQVTLGSDLGTGTTPDKVLPYAGSTKINWHVDDAKSCIGTDPSKPTVDFTGNAMDGSYSTGALLSSRTYSLTCQAKNSTINTCTANATVNVAPSTPKESLVVHVIGNGTVRGVGGIDCSQPNTSKNIASCLSSYDRGNTIVLTPTAGSNTSFTGWTGDYCTGTGVCTLPMTSSREVTAYFGVAPPTVTCFLPPGVTSAFTNQSVTWTATPSGAGLYYWSWTKSGTPAPYKTLTTIPASVNDSYPAPAPYTITGSVSLVGASGPFTACSNTVSIEPTQCSDGIDNDFDGKIDYPADPDCVDWSDNNETYIVLPPSQPPATLPVPTFQEF